MALQPMHPNILDCCGEFRLSFDSSSHPMFPPFATSALRIELDKGREYLLVSLGRIRPYLFEDPSKSSLNFPSFLRAGPGVRSEQPLKTRRVLLIIIVQLLG